MENFADYIDGFMTGFCLMIKISGCFVIQSLVFYNQQLCVAFFCVIIQKRF